MDMILFLMFLLALLISMEVVLLGKITGMRTVFPSGMLIIQELKFSIMTTNTLRNTKSAANQKTQNAPNNTMLLV
jgi:hypothetical protein